MNSINSDKDHDLNRIALKKIAEIEGQGNPFAEAKEASDSTEESVDCNEKFHYHCQRLFHDFTILKGILQGADRDFIETIKSQLTSNLFEEAIKNCDAIENKMLKDVYLARVALKCCIAIEERGSLASLKSFNEAKNIASSIENNQIKITCLVEILKISFIDQYKINVLANKAL